MKRNAQGVSEDMTAPGDGNTSATVDKGTVDTGTDDKITSGGGGDGNPAIVAPNEALPPVETTPAPVPPPLDPTTPATDPPRDNQTYLQEEEETLEEELQKALMSDKLDIKVNNTMFIPRHNPFHDLTLTVGDKTYQCNALVLSYSSSVFKAMLTGQWKESKEIQLVEDEFVQPYFSTFLDYLYGHKQQVDGESILPLLVLANKYSVWELQSRLCVALGEVVSTMNAVNMWKLSKKYGLHIEEKVMSFVEKCLDEIELEEEDDVEFWEELLKRDTMEVRNEYRVWKKLVNCEQYVSNGSLKRLLKCVRFENIHPVDIVCKVLKSSLIKLAPPEVLIKLCNVNFYRSMNLQPFPMKRRRYLEKLCELVVSPLPPKSHKFSIKKEFPCASLHFTFYEDTGEIGFFVDLQGLGVFHVRIGILNILTSKVVGRRFNLKKTKEDEGVMKGIRPFIDVEELYHPGNGFISSDNTITLLLAVSRISSE